MSSSDSFISEVSEEVRRDRLYKTFRKYGWIGILAVILIVGGAGFNEWRKAKIEAEAQAAGDAILAALDAESADARRSALDGVASGDNVALRAVVAMLAADADLDAGNVESALSAFDEIASDTTLPSAWRDLATLKAAIAGAGLVPADERIARLNALALGGGAFRLLAEEQIALAEIESGDSDAAISRLRAISEDAEASQDLQRRAAQLIVALGGSLTDG